VKKVIRRTNPQAITAILVVAGPDRAGGHGSAKRARTWSPPNEAASSDPFGSGLPNAVSRFFCLVEKSRTDVEWISDEACTSLAGLHRRAKPDEHDPAKPLIHERIAGNYDGVAVERESLIK
jgi:hypothetical protein